MPAKTAPVAASPEVVNAMLRSPSPGGSQPSSVAQVFAGRGRALLCVFGVLLTALIYSAMGPASPPVATEPTPLRRTGRVFKVTNRTRNATSWKTTRRSQREVKARGEDAESKQMKRLAQQLLHTESSPAVTDECDLSSVASLKLPRTMSMVLSMLPLPPSAPTRPSVLVLGTPSNQGLFDYVLRKRVRINVKPTSSLRTVIHTVNAQASKGLDIIYDANLLGTRTPSERLETLVSMLRYQGLYIADVGRKGSERDEAMRVAVRALVTGLHRPHGGGGRKRTYTRCNAHSRWMCDIPAESFHVSNGLLIVRNGVPHPHWDIEAGRWRAGTLRDNKNRDNKVDGPKVQFSPDVLALQKKLVERREAIDERSDGCWKGRKDFLTLANSKAADKGTHHGYWRGYGVLFPRDTENARIAELGLSAGSSLQVWLRWFNAQTQLLSVDMNDSRFARILATLNSQDKARTQLAAVDSPIKKWSEPDFDWEGSKRSVSIVTKAAEAGGGFNIIVDDAGHSALQNSFFFHSLFSSVRKGGLYVCEDLEAGGFLHLASRDKARVHETLRERTPVRIFRDVTAALGRGLGKSGCDGCDADAVAVHWWDETVVFEKAP
eukprot:Hpha_TRINITY_DN7583_c0_g1::TRINITY_DN7583_c0_g1_i2::g.19174::m.19174